MATNFPTSVDSFTNPSAGNTLDSPSHSGQHSDTNDAIEAIEGFLLNNYNPSFRNLIINGAMQVAQRGTSVTGITSGQYTTVDRWLFNISSLGTWTSTVENDAPTGSGFRKSFKMLCTTADASPAGTDYATILQKIEGQNLQQIAKGTSSAKQLSLSFWVKSNVTGTYSVMIYDNDNTRFTSFTYTISSSATWEKKTILIPADTTGVFDNDNNDSLQIYFNLGSGSSYTGGAAQSTWASFTGSETKWMPSQTNVAAAINNYFQITGVQLEVGEADTPYEFKPYDVELRQCQRYYYRLSASTGSAYATIFTSAVSQTNTNVYVRTSNPVPMRDVPSSIEFSNIAYHRWDGTLYAITAMSIDTATDTIYSATINATVSGGPGASTAGGVLANNNTGAYFGVSAEL